MVWGDFISQSPALAGASSPPRSATPTALRAEGGVADWYDLPKMGVAGNTHMLMMDKNSDQVAQMIQKWMADRGLMK